MTGAGCNQRYNLQVGVGQSGSDQEERGTAAGAPGGLSAWRAARRGAGETSGAGREAALPEIEDPLRVAMMLPPPRAGVSALAVLSMIALVLGPIGAVAALVLGWAARREIADAPTRRGGRGLATAGMTLGALLTAGWGAALALGAWAWTYERGEQVAASELEASVSSALEPASAPSPPSAPGPAGSVPQRTTSQRVGELTVIDVGIEVRTLAEELARQRADAFEVGDRLLVMTTSDPCEPCRGVDRALADPLMQTALRGVRLVRVHVEVFRDDLVELKIPGERIPGFFRLALDLAPEDGIDGGEWDEDIPVNIAPVLGAFVRGQYTVRREPWTPLPHSGMRL